MTDDDRSNAYQALAETTRAADARWAFGTGTAPDVEATEPVAAIDAPLPDGVDPSDLHRYCCMLADDALVHSQRLTGWAANAPELEEEMALANMALDLLGQARVLLARAGYVEGAGRDEDDLAYWRDEPDWRNVTLAEIDDRLDFGVAMARLLILSTWRLAVLQRLTGSTDPVLAAVADKGVKELAYHRDHAARWVVRLGDGTDDSHRRMQAALDEVWPYVEELHHPSEEERRLAAVGVAVHPADVRGEVDAVIDEVLAVATLARPDRVARGGLGGQTGRQGVHSEQLGPLLALMQSLARAHPGASW